MRKKSEDSRLKRYEVPSVSRAGKILRMLAAEGEPLGASEVSRRLNLPKASVFRILATLERERFIERTDGDRFEVGLTAYEVGAAYSRGINLESAFQRVARRLVAEHNETVQLAILTGPEILYIGREDSSQPVRLVSHLGSRLPASATALGKSMLSCLPERELHRLWPDGRLVQVTANSHPTLAHLLEDLRRTRERGWSHDNEEVSVGLQCVAAPIRDGLGRPLAAISIAVPSPRMSPGRLAVLAEAVTGAAREIAGLLGGSERVRRTAPPERFAEEDRADGDERFGDAA